MSDGTDDDEDFLEDNEEEDLLDSEEESETEADEDAGDLIDPDDVPGESIPEEENDMADKLTPAQAEAKRLFPNTPELWSKPKAPTTEQIQQDPRVAYRNTDFRALGPGYGERLEAQHRMDRQAARARSLDYSAATPSTHGPTKEQDDAADAEYTARWGSGPGGAA